MKAEVQWSREVTCLRFKDQKRIPDPDERIKLATMGLSNKLIMFNMSGDSSHIHEEILNAFPTLKDCGGSNLLRQGKGYHLIVLDPPNGGYTVKFLADVLNRAKLFVRPLQRDLSTDDTSIVWYVCAVAESLNSIQSIFCFFWHKIYLFAYELAIKTYYNIYVWKGQRG